MGRLRCECVVARLLLVALSATIVSAQEKPTLTIGGEDDRGYQMIGPREVIVTPNRIVIVERRAPYFRVLSKSGTLVQSYGRDGSGPGEFMTLAVVHDSVNRRLLAFDIKAGRVTYLALGDSLTFTRTMPISARPFTACLESGTPWIITGGTTLVTELKVTDDRLVPGRSFGTPNWLHPDAAKPYVRQYAIAPGGLLLCDSRTHTAFVMSPTLGEVHVVSLTTGADQLQRILNYATMQVSAEADHIEWVFPDNGIFDGLAGALVTRDGVEAVVEHHVLDRPRKKDVVTYNRVLILPDGTQRLVATSTWQPMRFAADGVYCYLDDPVPTLARYASGRCP